MTVTVTLTSTAPARGLPPYVVLREDQGAPAGNPRAENYLWVSLYAGVGSGFTGATLDGRPRLLSSDVERGHAVLSTYVRLAAGQTRTLVVRLREPAAGPVLTVRPQPLVAPEPLTVRGIGWRRAPIQDSP